MKAPTVPSSTPRAFRGVQCRHQLPLTLTLVRGPARGAPVRRSPRWPQIPTPAGWSGRCLPGGRARVAAFPSAPQRAAVTRADRSTDTTATAATSGTAISGTAISGSAISGSAISGTGAAGRLASRTAADDVGLAGLVTVEEVHLRAAEPLGVPARGVIAQVVVDIPRVAPIAPVGRRAAVPRRAYIAMPNVKVISFAAHAPSLVARRPRLAGMRPLPERRVRPSREPAEVKRYLLGRLLTGWSAHAASGVPQARQCPERRRKQGGSTRNFGRLRPHRPGIRRIRPPFPRVRVPA